ncbi:MAG: hypothetical protein VB142_09390 [Burkholderia sp.]
MTIDDAMGTQRGDRPDDRGGAGADYVLVVKDNQSALAGSLREWFASVQAGGLRPPYWESVPRMTKGTDVSKPACVG